ncbi:helix-turn-helix domain-containing protein [Burkholderia glumae]|uniref:helix-turn-helix domain-containing protein n=1 Tax=Burkholderia glumae TaxID=337 RepID=UPI0020373A72|nr:helix-turn-helix transcriptional regulator [Burkholderia glumae]MCM2543882.1 helix-turn-helix domain-containing protein [Burkholderia glumae]
MVTNDERQAFSDRLNLVLDEEGYPPKGSGRQNRLAKDWGLTQKGVRKWLEGEGVPETTRLIEIAKRYDVSFEWLATGRDPSTLCHSETVVRGAYSSTAPGTFSEEATALIRAIARADASGMPGLAFSSMGDTLRAFERLRGQEPPRFVDIHSPNPKRE